MTDEEAMEAALTAYAADVDDYTDEEEESGFRAGFRAGLAHRDEHVARLEAALRVVMAEGEMLASSGRYLAGIGEPNERVVIAEQFIGIARAALTPPPESPDGKGGG